jgi:hypothetical protein
MAPPMSSKARVRAALSHQEPDRVPINYFSNPEVDARLKAHYGLAPDGDEALRRALGVDFRCVGAPYSGPPLHAEMPGRRIDEWGIRRKRVEHATGGYWEYCDWPLRNATLDEIEAWPMPDPEAFDYGRVAEGCRRFADFCVVAGGPGLGDIINHTGMLRTMEQVLVDLATDQEAGLRLIDRRLDVQMEVLRRTLRAGAGTIDLVWIGEDLGTQIGPMVSPALFRRHIRPRLQRLVDLAKADGVPVMIHSCGSSSWAFGDFVEMGISAVDTLQPEAKDMTPAYLKTRWGGRLAMHGMISTAGPVSRGTPADVVADVRDTLAVMMPGGGYCLAPTHLLQANSPVENVVAMYEAAREFGTYR